MKILFVLTYYSPHWTGLTEHARRLAEGLVKRGHSVSVVTTQHKKDLPKQERIHGVAVYRTNVLFRLSRTLISFSFLPTILKVAKDADVVMLYTPLAEILPAVLLLKIERKKVVILHNGDLLLPKGIGNRILENFFDISSYFAGRLTDKLISYSDDYAVNSRFLKNFPEKTTSILPLFPDMQSSTKDIEVLKKKMPKHKRPIIGFAGRFVEEKGFDILLHAIPMVTRSYPNVLFVFAGEEHMVYEDFFEKHNDLLKQVNDSFFSFGLLKRNEMSAFYSLLDLFVLPSRSDCLAFVQVEAMKTHVPVVVSDIPGARIAVRLTGMGELVEKENPEALANTICKVLENSSDYTDKYSHVNKVFDYNTTLDMYESVFKSVQTREISL